jgi:hypothetical protein
MRATIVYESMYGNTHLIADAIAEGVRSTGAEARVLPVGHADTEAVLGSDLLIVGGPTHGHAMSRASTREAAVRDAQKPEKELEVDPDAEGEGLREWFDELPPVVRPAAAFDTRFDMSPLLTGRASKGISKRLRRHGCPMVAKPRSFFVQKGNTLVSQQREEAVEWGAQLANEVAQTSNA